MTSVAGSASEVKVQHRSLLIERGYEEFTGRLEQILGRFVPSKLKGLTPDGAMEALCHSELSGSPRGDCRSGLPEDFLKFGAYQVTRGG